MVELALARMRIRPARKTRHETGNRKPKKKLRHPLLKADVMGPIEAGASMDQRTLRRSFGPSGPLGTYFEIKVTPAKFDLLKEFDFVRIIVGSVDFKLDKELLLKDIETFLCLVPNYIPAILLMMDKAEYEEKVSSLTVFRLNDGRRTRDYLLAHVTNRK